MSDLFGQGCPPDTDMMRLGEIYHLAALGVASSESCPNLPHRRCIICQHQLVEDHDPLDPCCLDTETGNVECA